MAMYQSVARALRRRVKQVGAPGRQGGFTLIEMIIVLAVFAILSLVSGQIMSKVVNNFKVLNERGERLAAIHRAMGVMQRDILQITDRPVLGPLKDPLAPVSLAATGELSFTRAGWQNPLQRQRWDLQRVAYSTDDDTLYRGYWLHLDQVPDSEAISQVLLEGVSSVEFIAIDGAGNERTFWPPSLGSGAPSLPSGATGSPAPATASDPARRLVAILVRLELEPFGQIERLWMVSPMESS